MRMNKVGHLNEMIRHYFVKVRHTAFLMHSVHRIIHRAVAEWFLAVVSMVLKSYITQYEKIKLSQGKNIQNGELRIYTCIIEIKALICSQTISYFLIWISNYYGKWKDSWKKGAGFSFQYEDLHDPTLLSGCLLRQTGNSRNLTLSCVMTGGCAWCSLTPREWQ